MTTNPIFPREKRLRRFVELREEIRRKHDAGADRPYTDDVILATYRFCNIRRIDDRVSRWLLANWFPHFPFKGKWHAAVIARMINWPPTLERVRFAAGTCIGDFDADRFADALSAVAADGGKLVSGAYVIPGGAKGVSKPRHIAAVVASMLDIRKDVQAAIDDCSFESTVRAFEQVRGIGSFLAGQFSADLCYLPGQLAEASDLLTWAPRGPGSTAGFNVLLAREPKAAVDDAEWRVVLPKLTRIIREYVPDATGMDAQNVLCEFNKLDRALRGLRLKSYYTPHSY